MLVNNISQNTSSRVSNLFNDLPWQKILITASAIAFISTPLIALSGIGIGYAIASGYIGSLTLVLACINSIVTSNKNYLESNQDDISPVRAAPMENSGILHSSLSILRPSLSILDEVKKCRDIGKKIDELMNSDDRDDEIRRYGEGIINEIVKRIPNPMRNVHESYYESLIKELVYKKLENITFSARLFSEIKSKFGEYSEMTSFMKRRCQT